MNYKQQLKTKKWKEKRVLILERDNYCCSKCGSKNKLQVHHKKYIYGRMAWEYPNSFLTTVCSTCHLKIHNLENIKTVKYFTKKKKTLKKNKPKKYKMSKKDKEIQKLYDKINKKSQTN